MDIGSLARLGARLTVGKNFKLLRNIHMASCRKCLWEMAGIVSLVTR